MRQQPLEEKIREALLAVPDDASLAKLYTDPSDRQRVRRRALIAATLEAIFQFDCERHQENEDGSIAVGTEPTVFSELAAVQRDFAHDQTLIDLGRNAELVLRPVGRESVNATRTIKAARKHLVRWLALIDLWDKERDVGFSSQIELLNFAAAKGAGRVGSLRVELSKLRNGLASGEELTLFHDTIDLAKRLSEPDGASSPFQLLLPAVLSLSMSAQRNA